jgi:hypothetical protein
VAIDDLALKSVSVVDRYDQTELPPPGDLRDLIARMAGDPSLETSLPAPSPTDMVRLHELLLKVEFTSAVDLTQIPYSDNVAPEFFLCDRPRANLRLRLPGVYQDGVVIRGSTSGDTHVVRANSSGQRNGYYIYMRLALKEVQPGNPPFESFDLANHPESVCFRLLGGRYRKLGYRSNVVAISPTLIFQSLQDSSLIPATLK